MAAFLWPQVAMQIQLKKDIVRDILLMLQTIKLQTIIARWSQNSRV